MKRAIVLPRKYIQGSNLLTETAHYVSLLGKRPLLLWGNHARAATHDLIMPGMKTSGLDPIEALFNGECTKDEAQRVITEATTRKADVIVGIGGGKVIDTAKAVAVSTGLPIVIIPTIASNDAPTSACTVWYNDKGECVGFDLWKFNPDIILVDTNVIANAPVRFFVAGMGDALATWPEALAAYRSQAVSCAGGVPTTTAITMAKLCFDTLMEYGIEAKKAVEKRSVTPALEKVVEADILLSGIGWESGGLACAHAIANNLPIFHETHGYLHGEKVAFGLMTQLCLEKDREQDEILRIVDLMVTVGLPVTFADLNMADVSEDRLKDFAKQVTAEGSFIHNHNFKVTAASVLKAMHDADALGRKQKQAIS